MKNWIIGVFLGLTVLALAACGGAKATPAADEGVGESYSSAVLDTSYDGALSVSNQLALGTIELEKTENAVTPEQAKSLLPLWQALQGGVTAQVEVNAVLKQIEGAMSQEQLQAIAATQLTREDMGAWMQKEGLSWGGSFRGAQSTGQAQADGAGVQPGGGPGGGAISPEMATRRAQFEGMSEAERAALRATVEAGGGFPGAAGGRGGASREAGQSMIILNPLIELLTQRAAE